ncbi:MAG: hypothetical protein RMK19_02010 [Bacteroidia bacterium]|nr:hypothetical protein [Bacteroidia bacterium]MDW8014769.1 hypothetical protein [Bacteroidia bacterium]
MVEAVVIGLMWAQTLTARYSQAQLYTRQRAWDSALAVWRTLLLIERDSSRRALIYQQLGYIAVQRGDSGEALRLWRESLRYKPDYLPALRNYQWLFLRLRRPPPPSPPLRSLYEPPLFPSEQQPPSLGNQPFEKGRKPRWLPVERLSK